MILGLSTGLLLGVIGPGIEHWPIMRSRWPWDRALAYYEESVALGLSTGLL